MGEPGGTNSGTGILPVIPANMGGTPMPQQPLLCAPQGWTYTLPGRVDYNQVFQQGVQEQGDFLCI